MRTFDHGWYWTLRFWLPARDGDERIHLLAEALCLISEERQDKIYWSTERWTNIRINQEWNQRGQSGRISLSHFHCPLRFEAHVYGDPYPRMAISFKLIPCIITFDLIYIIIHLHLDICIKHIIINLQHSSWK